MHLLYIILYICVLFYNKKDFFFKSVQLQPFQEWLSLHGRRAGNFILFSQEGEVYLVVD